MNETIYQLEVRPVIPKDLAGLTGIANNLLYSWDRNARSLFYRLDAQLWHECDHNPIVFLRRVDQHILDEATENHIFLEEYNRVRSSFETYLTKESHQDIEPYLDPNTDLVAYFCAEFGLHESFPIYSGGLGILAGDHCKAASDMGVPFVAIGLLYRQGYFSQEIDSSGNQIAVYNSTSFRDLPISPAKDENGEDIYLDIELPGRMLKVRAWKAQAGHISLYLLDSNQKENSPDDRQITFRLYGGSSTTRIEQEIVLGIGGVQLLRKLNLHPTAWHINEGHAAFQILERCRELVETGQLDFKAALENVAGGTVFTTHTPVPAGHDIFTEAQVKEYLYTYTDSLGISFENFMLLGASPINPTGFNMTALAIRGSRFHNGVSRIHGGIASSMESYIWPQIPEDENPMSYVTNGVHIYTFLAREWVNLFDMRFREWRNKLLDKDYWNCIETIPDHRFWSLRQELKTQMLEDVHRRTLNRYKRNGANEALIRRVTQHINKPDADVLVMGFARRFATYKRATLLFRDPDKLARILNNPEKPVLLVFAGKAHPKDEPGQQLIRMIQEYSLKPEFIGRIILLEDYNMAMARKLVTGVDVWINTPEYPMEASGTSGQKAAINGVLNLSVLDGWWGEGYNGHNGWAITPHDQDVAPNHRDAEESNDLLDLIEHEIVPIFYNRGNQGYSRYWVKLSKAAMSSCIPQFNAARMMRDYVSRFYAPARNQHIRLSDSNREPSIELANWKQNIHEQWHKISIERVDHSGTAICHGEGLPLKVLADINGLSPSDVVVECLVGNMTNGKLIVQESYQLQHETRDGDKHLFTLELKPKKAGLNYYKIRIYPYHELLSHRFETGYMVWL